MDQLTTMDLLQRFEELMQTEYRDLYLEYGLFALACLLAAASSVLFILRLFCRSVYVHRNTTPLNLHVTLILLLPAAGGWELYRAVADKNMPSALISILLLVFALWCSVQLCRFRTSGCVGAAAFFWIYGAVKQCIWLKRIIRDQRILMDAPTAILPDITGTVLPGGERALSMPAKYVYGLVYDDYFITAGMTVAAICLGATVLLAFYYNRRRLIFQTKRLSGLPRCAFCGRVIEKGDQFCRNCGKAAASSKALPFKRVLDEREYCEKCGRDTGNNSKKCLICEKGKSWKEYGVELFKSTLAAATGMLLVYLILLVAQYHLSSLLLENLLSSQNAVMEKCEKVMEDPSLVENQEWVRKFDADLEALYLVDARWAYMRRRGLKIDNIPFYYQYTEASYQQMYILEELRKAVSEKAPERIAGLNADLINTARGQIIAVFSTRNRPLRDWGSVFGYMLVDALRFYFTNVNFLRVSVFMIGAAFVLLCFVLNSFSGGRPAAAENKFARTLQGLENSHFRYSVVYTPAAKDAAAAKRIARILYRGFFYHLYRMLCELWVLVLGLLAAVSVFLSIFRPVCWKRLLNWLRDGLRWGREDGARYAGYRKSERKQWRIAVIIAVLLFVGMYAKSWPESPETEDSFMEACSQVLYGDSQQISLEMMSGRIPSVQLIDRELERIDAYESFVEQNEELITDRQFKDKMDGFCQKDREILLDLRKAAAAGQYPSEQVRLQYLDLWWGGESREVLERISEYLEEQLMGMMQELVS